MSLGASSVSAGAGRALGCGAAVTPDRDAGVASRGFVTLSEEGAPESARTDGCDDAAMPGTTPVSAGAVGVSGFGGACSGDSRDVGRCGVGEAWSAPSTRHARDGRLGAATRDGMCVQSATAASHKARASPAPPGSCPAREGTLERFGDLLRRAYVIQGQPRRRAGRQVSPPGSGERGSILPSQRAQQGGQCTERVQFGDERHRGGMARLRPQGAGEREAERVVSGHPRVQSRNGQPPEPGVQGQPLGKPGGQQHEGFQFIPEVDRLRGGGGLRPRMHREPRHLAHALLHDERERGRAAVRVNRSERQLADDQHPASGSIRKGCGAQCILQEDRPSPDERGAGRRELHLAHSPFRGHRSSVRRGVGSRPPRCSGSENFATVFSARFTLAALVEKTRARAVPVPRSSTTAWTV